MTERPHPAPFPDSCRLLEGAHLADSYRLVISGEAIDAIEATRRVLFRAPRWIGGLMFLRNRLVRPFGLKTAAEEALQKRDGFAPFPVISQSPERVVLGLDDRHLDFRVCVDVEKTRDGRQTVTASSIVRAHNALGRVYLALVTPFHRIVVPAMLAQAATPLSR
ncbi:DUF2867 domain-containing protein [Terrarubrum flagellatum]|uniref:DUF2867 domain-containing protein n=1 Tax=Terrirubrum flagellatum TaxID=2895980 RepID=UPI003144DCD7